MRRLALALLTLPFLLAGCGSDDEGGNSFADVPDCGEALSGEVPENFEGCQSGPDKILAVGIYECADGSELYALDGPDGEPTWGVEGGEWQTGSEDEYGSAITNCNSGPAEEETEPASSGQCADIWVDGETLPSDYTGCEGAQNFNGECDSGGPYFGVALNDTELYAQPGGVIADENGPGYDVYFTACFTD